MVMLHWHSQIAPRVIFNPLRQAATGTVHTTNSAAGVNFAIARWKSRPVKTRSDFSLLQTTSLPLLCAEVCHVTLSTKLANSDGVMRHLAQDSQISMKSWQQKSTPGTFITGLGGFTLGRFTLRRFTPSRFSPRNSDANPFSASGYMHKKVNTTNNKKSAIIFFLYQMTSKKHEDSFTKHCVSPTDLMLYVKPD